MKEKEKTEFRKFMLESRNEDALIRMFRAFEKCDPFKEAQGVIKRIIVLPDGSDYRLFLRLKNLLFEFEITSKRVKYFKREDINTYLHIVLKKEFLVAQMLTERDAYVSSINSMINTFKKAQKFDFIQIQKDCADNLSQYYRLTGNNEEADHWYKVSGTLNQSLSDYNRFRGLFEKNLNSISCCEEHRERPSPHLDLNYNGDIPKIKWMSDVLKLNLRRDDEDAFDSFKQSNHLYHVIKRNPGVYPKEFRVVILKYVFQDIYRLGMEKALNRWAYEVFILNKLPLYNRIPILNFFIHFLLKNGNLKLLKPLLEMIESEKAFFQFTPFMKNVKKIKIIMYYKLNGFKLVLRELNQQDSGGQDCEYIDFFFRILEILCLQRVSSFEVVHDRIESLRRYIFRNENLKDSTFHREVYTHIRSLVNQNDLEVMNINYSDKGDVYDLRPILIEMISNLSSYSVQEENEHGELHAAESDPFSSYSSKK